LLFEAPGTLLLIKRNIHCSPSLIVGVKFAIIKINEASI